MNFGLDANSHLRRSNFSNGSLPVRPNASISGANVQRRPVGFGSSMFQRINVNTASGGGGCGCGK